MHDIDPHTHTGQLWTRERVLAALCDWITEHGAAPTGPELRRAREAESTPSHLKQWPPLAAIHTRFGSFDKAIAAAEAAHPAHLEQQTAAFREAAARARRSTLMRMKTQRELENRYGDPKAQSGMVSGPHLPDPAPPRRQGREPNAGMTFATRMTPGVYDDGVRTIHADDAPDPYGPEGTEVGEDIYEGGVAILRERYQTLPDGQPSGRRVYEDGVEVIETPPQEKQRQRRVLNDVLREMKDED